MIEYGRWKECMEVGKTANSDTEIMVDLYSDALFAFWLPSVCRNTPACSMRHMIDDIPVERLLLDPWGGMQNIGPVMVASAVISTLEDVCTNS